MPQAHTTEIHITGKEFPVKFSRTVFLIAAMYGVIVTLPLYFAEQQLALQYPPGLTHPEYYYTFAGVTLVWQILFILIAYDPQRYRPVMLICMLEKASLLPTLLILGPRGAFPQLWIPLMIIDLVLGLLFLISFFLVRQTSVNT
jgi:hypothetical protein